MAAAWALTLSSPQYGFAQWFPQTIPNDLAMIQSVDFINPNIGAAVGYGTGEHAIYTTNGGLDWTIAEVPDSTRFLGVLEFTDTLTGYAVGSIGSDMDFRGLFVRTTDAGRTWHEYGTLPESVFVLTGMSFVNSQIGFLMGDEAIAYGSVKVLKTTNGGLGWTLLPIPDSLLSLEGVAFLDSLHGFSAGYGQYGQQDAGIIIATSDGGMTWSQRDFPSISWFRDIHFPSHSTGYALGTDTSAVHRGVLYKTTDSGSTWFLLAVAPDSAYLDGVRFTGDSGTGIVFGKKGTQDTLYTAPFIGRTTDEGNTWSYQVLEGFPQGSSLSGGKMITDSIGFICGGSVYGAEAIMLKTTNGGTTSVQFEHNGTIMQFHLAQNYPNPFNPSTTIRFSIPRSGEVILKIFNLLGEEVATLVSGHRDAGTNKIQWDATGQPSGVYFYRLQAGEFVETRKLVLLR